MSSAIASAIFYPRHGHAAASLGYSQSRTDTAARLPVAVKSPKWRIWLRIALNLMASGVVLLSLVTTFVLLSQGMFDRLIATWYFQGDTDYWGNYGASCILDAAGFVAGTCSAMEVATTETPAAWAALGRQLAAGWLVPLGAAVKVTTCIVGGTPQTGWVALQFISGYDAFPSCNPTAGGQDVVGMAMLESANLEDIYPDGAYLLSLFADAASPATVVYNNTDGTSSAVVADIPRVLVGRDGSVQTYAGGVNAVLNSHPLGTRYLVQGYCISQFIDIGEFVEGLDGWSMGRDSRKSVVPGWACGHRVSHATELLLLQALCGLLSALGLAPDMYVTAKGLQGVLTGKPVLTYDVLSGLERRKWLLVFVTLSAVPSLLFIDVARIYFGTENGLKIWLFSITSLATLFAFAAFVVLVMVQHVPSPRCIRHTLVPLSAVVLLYGAVPAIALNTYDSYQALSNLFYAGVPTIVLNINGTEYPCGAYDPSGVATATEQLLSSIVVPLAGCAGASVLYAVVKTRIVRRKWCLDTRWSTGNAFMQACGVPNWVTSLPLDETEAIRIGNRHFCKPSMQARLGFASVVPAVATNAVHVRSVREAEDKMYFLISIYDLLFATTPHQVRAYRPRIYGEITRNGFRPATTRRLDGSTSYQLSRGTCAG
ncbi:hypothetical protein ACHHYP_02509 [Achlya hypogyna]|uniref:Transmembrane protein n=1 Tax=Achlya hypogyna TaxID=1202772 RepID=A0A1V9Z6L0_ACHHY|nr:hypothetical protein ACHHYP_02509 [Achlya hypogyna]